MNTFAHWEKPLLEKMVDFDSNTSIPIQESLPIDYDTYLILSKISHWIYPIWAMLFIIIGTTGNIFSLIIYIRWPKRLSVYTYFILLCLVNLLIINFDITYHYFLPFLIDKGIIIHNYLPMTCKLIYFLTYFLRYLFIWLVVMINIDRCLYLTENPFKSILCQQRSAVVICVILIIFSFSANCHFLIFLKSSKIKESLPRNQCVLDDFYFHCKSSHTNYQYFFKKIWPIYNLIIFALMPSVIIFISLILIIRKIYFTKQVVCDYYKRRGSITSITSHDHVFRSIAKTLICLDLLFPLTIFPILFFQIYINYNPPETCRSIGIINLICSIGFAISFIKNTFAFFIFYLTGREFRRSLSVLMYRKNVSAFSQTN